MNIGDIEINGLYIGTEEAIMVCLGDEVVWSGGTPPVPPTPSGYTDMPLTFEILSNGDITWRAIYGSFPRTIEYSLNGGAWSSITSTSSGVLIQVSSGDTVQFRGDNATYCNSSGRYSKFEGTASFNAYGNIMSLIDSTGYTSATTFTENKVFQQLFGSSNLVNAENLVLPATSLTVDCYNYMFINCRSLTTAPVLPAATLANYCYFGMFQGCTALTSITCYATNTAATMCTKNWTNNVASAGTFTKADNMTGWTRGTNGIPWAWSGNGIPSYIFFVEFTSGNPNEVPATGGALTVSITSNVPWTASTTENWITLSQTAGTSSQTIVATVSQNQAYSERNANLNIITTQAGLSYSKTIIQKSSITPIYDLTITQPVGAVQTIPSGGQPVPIMVSYSPYDATVNLQYYLDCPLQIGEIGTDMYGNPSVLATSEANNIELCVADTYTGLSAKTYLNFTTGGSSGLFDVTVDKGMGPEVYPFSNGVIPFGQFQNQNIIYAIIGDGIRTIEDYAFCDNNNTMTAVTIGSGVTYIGGQVFQHAPLSSVTIPASVTGIGVNAFFAPIGEMIFESDTPAQLDDGEGKTLGGQEYTPYPIYVPDQAVWTYQQAWPNYASRIQSIWNRPPQV